MSKSMDLSVIVAIENSHENLELVLKALAPHDHPDVQFMLGVTEGGALPAVCTEGSNIVAVVAPAGSRVPDIWAEGIRRSKSRFVGLLTAQFIPCDDWVTQARQLEWQEDLAACGGAIVNSDDAKPLDWAIFILRYGRFVSPTSMETVGDIAADNAVYRRDLIMREPDLLSKGFWEPAFHAQFQRQGFVLAAAPRLIAEQHNCYTAQQFANQRYAHGTEFGLQRAEAASTIWKSLMILLAPLVLFVFLAKVLVAAIRNSYCKSHVLRACGWLVFFVACWSAGETRGYFRALRQPSRGV